MSVNDLFKSPAALLASTGTLVVAVLATTGLSKVIALPEGVGEGSSFYSSLVVTILVLVLISIRDKFGSTRRRVVIGSVIASLVMGSALGAYLIRYIDKNTELIHCTDFGEGGEERRYLVPPAPSGEVATILDDVDHNWTRAMCSTIEDHDRSDFRRELEKDTSDQRLLASVLLSLSEIMLSIALVLGLCLVLYSGPRASEGAN